MGLENDDEIWYLVKDGPPGEKGDGVGGGWVREEGLGRWFAREEVDLIDL